MVQGLGMRATARVFEVDPNTVLHWLADAAEQLRAFTSSFLCDMHVRQLQLDELYAVLRGVNDGDISDDQAIKRLERSHHWVWTAIDPESKLLLAIEVGSRTLAMAQRVVHQVVQRLASTCVPLWLSDGFKGYRPAILGHCGVWHQPERTRAQGPASKPRWRPRPGLLYAQVIKQYRRKRLIGVKHYVVFGTLGAIEQVFIGVWLEDQYGLCGEAESGYPATRSGGETPRQHAVPGQGWLAASADGVPRLPQFRTAPCEPAPAPPGSRTHQRHGFSQGVAAVDASDGGWID
jgi:IS1 family transposase